MIDSTPQQLGLPVSLSLEARFDGFVAMPDNLEAFAELKNFCTPSRSNRLLGLWSDGIAGVSHLLQAVCYEAEEHGLRAQYLPLKTLLELPAAQVCEGMETFEVVCVDDVDSCIGYPEWQRALFALFNSLTDRGHAFLWSMHTSPSTLGMELVDLQSRLLSAVVYRVDALDDEHKIEMLISRSNELGMDMTEELGQYILSRVPRDPGSLLDFVARLDALSLSQQRKLTIPFVSKVIKGEV